MEESNNKDNQSEEKPREVRVNKENSSILKKLLGFYDNQYKLLLIIPFALLILSILLIGAKYATTGDFINKDVTLKGGVTLTITEPINLDANKIKSGIQVDFPDNDIEIRKVSQFGKNTGLIIVIDTTQDKVDSFLSKVEEVLNLELTTENHTIQVIGSSLGESFFAEVARALLIAFFFMGAVVSFYFGPDLKFKFMSGGIAILSSIILFANWGIVMDIIAIALGIFLFVLFIRSSIPSFAVVLAAFSDIIVTLALVNLFGIKLSTAGIAAFLMLIGYSVDTNILLSTRVIKRREGTVMDRILGAMKTGLTMTLTTFLAISAAFIFTESEVIKQIMLILLIGLGADLINTWLQNSGILRLYLEKKQK